MSRGRHRAEGNPIVWKFVRAYYRNRWYAFVKPAIRKFFNG